MTAYYVSDAYDWHDATSYTDAVQLAFRLQAHQDEPVQIFEDVDWHTSLTTEERAILTDIAA